VLVLGYPPFEVNGGSASTWGVLQVAHGCVEKTADEHGVLHGVEQSPIQADGVAIIGLMLGQSTTGSSRDMMQHATGFEDKVAGTPSSATLISRSCGVSASVAALVEVVGGRKEGGEVGGWTWEGKRTIVPCFSAPVE
jgi:hypothetical protein